MGNFAARKYTDEHEDVKLGEETHVEWLEGHNAKMVSPKGRMRAAGCVGTFVREPQKSPTVSSNECPHSVTVSRRYVKHVRKRRIPNYEEELSYGHKHERHCRHSLRFRMRRTSALLCFCIVFCLLLGPLEAQKCDTDGTCTAFVVVDVLRNTPVVDFLIMSSNMQ
jgi:hypothetical protein